MQGPSGLVAISNVQLNEYLTHLLFHPHVLASGTDFIRSHDRFKQVEAGPQTSQTQHALMVGWKPDTSALIYFIISVSFLSILAGILVGVLAHNAALGITASASCAALLSCIEGILLWNFRSRE
jgi:hypothetical protein